VRYITDFGLIARYHSHTDSTVKYMRTYLRKFHESKDVFLRYRASKKARRRAEDISKQFTKEIDRRRVTDMGLSAAQRVRLVKDDQEERAYRISQALEEDSHFNFPKLHLLSYYADQIAQYGSLPQYSTEICEASHKPLKDTYHRSNHIDSIPQIIDSYTREHNFAVREMNMALWARNDPKLKGVLTDVIRGHYNTDQFSCRNGEPVWMRLQGKYSSSTIYRLTHVGQEFGIPEVVNDVIEFFANNEYQSSRNPQGDTKYCLTDVEVQGFTGVVIPIPDQDVAEQNTYKVQHIRSTGKKSWRGKGGRRDLVWVNIEGMKLDLRTRNGRVESLNGRLPAFLNALFNGRRRDGALYKLAHVSLLQVVGNPTPHGPEGMSVVEEWIGGHKVVLIRCLEGAAHLVPLEPSRF